MEWRIVHVNTIGRKKYDPFKDFGESEAEARYFMEHGEFECSSGGTKRLESRPVGGGPEDWKVVEWEPAL